MTPYHEAIKVCGLRYQGFNVEDKALSAFIEELLQGCEACAPVPKLCRWLGYIQGLLIERGYTTVTAERDWTRPLFRPLDFPEE